MKKLYKKGGDIIIRQFIVKKRHRFTKPLQFIKTGLIVFLYYYKCRTKQTYLLGGNRK